MLKSRDPYLTVTDATRLINDTFEAQFPQLLFHGEISQLTVAASGHLYFSVKDQGAQLSCVMWAGMARTLPFKPAAGVAVRVHGRPNIYAQSGRFQIVVSRLLQDGEGELQRRFIELRDRLQREGFFSQERKRELPFLPRAVGVVTSKTGAVLHDIMVKINERFPSMVVYLSETRVQGEGAAREISAAIAKLDRSGLVDVIIVARGGGSLEDLWAFNEEEVVKAVFAASVPVVSGVGHETDTTLCDLAADVRAPTPTAAAEMVVPKMVDLLGYIGELERRMSDYDRWLQPLVQQIDEFSIRLDARISATFGGARLKVETAEAKLSSIRPDRVLELLLGKIEILHARLYRTGVSKTDRFNALIGEYGERLRRALPIEKLLSCGGAIDSLAGRLSVGVQRAFSDARVRAEGLEARLDALNPRKVIERGYSIVRINGRSVRHIGDVASGDELAISVVDGTVVGTVTKTVAS